MNKFVLEKNIFKDFEERSKTGSNLKSKRRRPG